MRRLATTTASWALIVGSAAFLLYAFIISDYQYQVVILTGGLVFGLSIAWSRWREAQRDELSDLRSRIERLEAQFHTPAQVEKVKTGNEFKDVQLPTS